VSASKPFAPIFINGTECRTESEAHAQLLTIVVRPRDERDPIAAAVNAAAHNLLNDISKDVRS
jgi:hypothetical protein